MGAVRLALLLAALVATMLAGCAETPSASNLPDTLQVEDVAVDPGSALGAISGVVVDEAIRPVKGASVEVQGLGNVTTSDAGTFAFKDLQPGAYFLSVAAPRFLPVQTSVEVRAGQSASVRVLLPVDPTPQPFHQTIQFDGFIQANPGAAGYLLDIVLVDVLNQSLCTCVWRFDSGNATTIVFEMVWESTGDPPTEPADLYYQMYEEDKSDITIESEFVHSPYLAHFDRESIWGDWTYFRVHFGGSSTWVNFNQAFTSYVTFFYNGEAPEGWSIASGNT